MTNESYEKLKQLIESIENVDKSLISTRELNKSINSILMSNPDYGIFDMFKDVPNTITVPLNDEFIPPVKKQLKELNKFRYTGVNETPIVFTKDSSAAPILDNNSMTVSINEPEIPIEYKYEKSTTCNSSNM